MGTGRAELNVFPVLLIETLFVWMRGKPIRDLHPLRCVAGRDLVLRELPSQVKETLWSRVLEAQA